MATTEERASTALQPFYKDTREDGKKFWTYDSDAETTPDWLQDLCMHAHGDFLPDDWRYEFIVTSLMHLASGDEDPEELFYYNGAILNWLASNLNRAGYVDEWCEEAGHSDSIITDIFGGLQREYEETFQIVLEFLVELIEEEEEEEEEDER